MPPNRPLPAIPGPAMTGENLSSKVKKVMDTEFNVNGIQLNFWITIGNEYNDKKTDQPYEAAIVALEGALEKHRLNQQEKVELFTYLEWKFACHDCKVYRGAAKYKTVPFIYWGDKYPAVVSLRSGPCEICKQENKVRGPDDKVAGVAYKVINPDWTPPTPRQGGFF